MERIKPMLGEIELQQVQQLDIDADQILTRHEIPGLESDFFQQEGRRGSKITLSGVVSGAESGEGLKLLREQFRAAEPVSFVADIISATDLDEVLIKDMEITEIAGKPNRFEYAFTLLEYTAPPAEPTEPPPIIPPPLVQTATLIVEVIVLGDQDFDFSRVLVHACSTQESGTNLFLPLTNRNHNIWTEENFPPGQYTVKAVVPDTPQMSGTADAEVRDGETTQVTITLSTGAVIAKSFMIHFRFDSAFSEPCMLQVLKQVSDYAAAHRELKLVVLGHTDLAGSVSYNQSLSERRARSAFSVLRFGNDNQAAVDEWDQIRRTRVFGVSLGDSWGTREYQQMLQELHIYHGRIDADHGPATDTAVKQFQTDNGLDPTGNVDDLTWQELIRQYLAQADLSIPDSQFLANCDPEILKWLGCGELDPVRDVTFAWRPNRRSEFLFVQDTSLPSDVVQPDTFNKPSPGAVNSDWCLNDSSVFTHCCFVKPHVGNGKETCTRRRDPWLREAAEPQPTFVVKGSIKFGDGSPFANGEYTLIAPDGEFMDGEVPTSTSSRRAGTGFKGTTKPDGTFEYSDPAKHKRPGIFTFEIEGDFVVRLEEQTIDDAKGPVVCKRLASDTDEFNVIIVPAAIANIRPSITAPPIVVVKKLHTNPQRQPVTLSVNQAFSGSGILTRSVNDRVQVFTTVAGGTALQFDGVDNVFSDAALLAGVTLFTEGGPNPSAAVDDVTLTLSLTVNGQAGFSANDRMTSVRLTLDVALSRSGSGVDPTLMPQNDKIKPGRALQVKDPGFAHERVMVIVRKAEPGAVNATLEITTMNNQIQLFTEADEVPQNGQTALLLPHPIANPAIPAQPAPPGANLIGAKFFAEGLIASTNPRDTGLQLGIQALEPDGDRINVNVLQVEVTDLNVAAGVTFVRFGMWDNAFNAASVLFNNQAEANNFVGADTRRFHIRIRDILSRGNAQVTANWRTINQAGNNLDAPANPGVTLIETPANSGIFISRGLMLVTDSQDQNQGTHSGLAGGAVVARGNNDHRIRRGDLRGNLISEYPVAGLNPMPTRPTVFQRTPENRRRFSIQVFVLRVAVGGAGVIPTNAGAALYTTDLRVMRETYARIGFEVDTAVRPGTPAADIVTVGTDSVVLIDPPAGVNPANVSFADETTLGTAHLTIANNVRVFFVSGLASGNGGEAWSDAIAPGVDPRRATVFTIQTTGPYAATHEVGHVLTNKLGSGHYNAPAVPAGNRLHDDQNLMTADFLGAERINGPKRLWDANDADVFNQVSAIRGSRFMRNF